MLYGVTFNRQHFVNYNNINISDNNNDNNKNNDDDNDNDKDNKHSLLNEIHALRTVFSVSVTQQLPTVRTNADPVDHSILTAHLDCWLQSSPLTMVWKK